MPYMLGIAIINSSYQAIDFTLIPSIYLLLLSRLFLKDFRDIKGDLQNSKTTFIIKYGKKITCVASATSFLAGILLMMVAKFYDIWFLLFLIPFTIMILTTKFKLLSASDKLSELKLIGSSKIIGNGILLMLIGDFILNANNNNPETFLLFYASLLIIFGYLFIDYLLNPKNIHFRLSRSKQNYKQKLAEGNL